MKRELFDKDLTLEPTMSSEESSPRWQGETKPGVFWKLFQGDALRVLSTFPSSGFDCVVTSPPYFWLRDYGVMEQIGLEDSVFDYVDAISTVMDQILRVLKKEGVLFLNLGDTFYSGKGESQGKDKKSSKRRIGLRAVDKSGGLDIGIRPKSIIGIPWRVAIEMMKRGWILRSSIIWHRTYRLPEAVRDRPRRSYEFVFMFVKEKKYYFNRDNIKSNNIEEDLWTIPAKPRPTNGIDTAPYPDELVKRCLDIGCPPGGIVLDPFAGSGTTIRVSIETNRSATGIELNEDFCKFIAKSIGSR